MLRLRRPRRGAVVGVGALALVAGCTTVVDGRAGKLELPGVTTEPGTSAGQSAMPVRPGQLDGLLPTPGSINSQSGASFHPSAAADGLPTSATPADCASLVTLWGAPAFTRDYVQRKTARYDSADGDRYIASIAVYPQSAPSPSVFRSLDVKMATNRLLTACRGDVAVSFGNDTGRSVSLTGTSALLYGWEFTESGSDTCHMAVAAAANVIGQIVFCGVRDVLDVSSQAIELEASIKRVANVPR